MATAFWIHTENFCIRKLTERVIKMYKMYHSEAIENAFKDIDRMIAEKE